MSLGKPIPVAVRSKALVFGRSPGEIVGSNTSGGMDVCFVCSECCVLPGRGLCDGLITRPEESYRLWRIVLYDQEISKIRRIKLQPGCENTTTMRCNAKKTNKQQQTCQLDSCLTVHHQCR